MSNLDIEKRIEKIEETVEDNNRMLRKIRRKEIFNFWFNIIKIALFLGVFYYSYQFIEPYLNALSEIYSSVKGAKDTLSLGANGIDINKFIEFFSSK